MENKVFSKDNFKKYYLKEFEFFDGEEFITFNIVSINFDTKVIMLAVTNRGKISVLDFDLNEDNNGLYFRYGIEEEKVSLTDFAEVNNETYFN